jgi:hypothetical protein
MLAPAPSRHRRLLIPLLIIAGAIGLLFYGVVALISEDPLWFLGRAELPAPRHIVIRVNGEDDVLTPSSPGYDALVAAAGQAMSAFENLAPSSAGLSEETLEEYERQGVTLALYFDTPVDFHLPFSDGRPTALLIPIQGRYAERGYVFRGKRGKWWGGAMRMSDPRPLYDALSTLGYIQR